MFFTELLAKFPTELSIIQYFISIRYHTDRPTCNHCGSYRVSHCHDKPKKFQCNKCNNKRYSRFKKGFNRVTATFGNFIKENYPLLIAVESIVSEYICSFVHNVSVGFEME